MKRTEIFSYTAIFPLTRFASPPKISLCLFILFTLSFPFRLMPSPRTDPVLSRFRARLDALYGRRIERVVLYGSRGRADARSASDYDIAVFLRGLSNRMLELNRLADLGTDILYEEEKIIRALPFRAGAYRRRTPLMHEIRKDGRDL
jgi:predicted nucleotidyltransferase